jgi:hypothetical protein
MVEPTGVKGLTWSSVPVWARVDAAKDTRAMGSRLRVERHIARDLRSKDVP